MFGPMQEVAGCGLVGTRCFCQAWEGWLEAWSVCFSISVQSSTGTFSRVIGPGLLESFAALLYLPGVQGGPVWHKDWMLSQVEALGPGT